MAAYLIKRLLGMIPVLFLVSVVTFSLVHLLPGDPATAMLGETTTQEDLDALRSRLGLDRPLYLQYLSWVGRALRGDLGTSLRTQQPVLELIGQRAVPTLALTIASLGVAFAIAIPVGILSALRRNSWVDHVATVLALAGAATPNFWLGVMLILFFAVQLGILPASGFADPIEQPGLVLKQLILPSLTLGTGITATILRQLRGSMLDVLAQDFVTTARSKGLVERAIVRDHVIKNAVMPVLTVTGILIGGLLGGAVITETIFAIPGIGRLAADSIFTRDFPTMQGVVLVAAMVVLLTNFVVDILYAYLDPRIRYT